MAVPGREVGSPKKELIPGCGFGEFRTEESQLFVDAEDPSKRKYSEAGERVSTGEDMGPYLPYISDYSYFRDLRRFPLLSPEEESDLAKRISDGKKRIKVLLLLSPIGLQWMAQTAMRLEKGEIRPEAVIEVSGKRIKNRELELKRRFISCAREVLELSIKPRFSEEEVGVPGQEDPATILNVAAVDSLLEGIPIKAGVLKQLETDVRKQVKVMSCSSEIPSSDGYVKPLETVLSAVQESRDEIREARDKLVEANLGFVVSIARKHVNLGLPLPDLIQEGNIGLLKAIDRFDYRKGHRLCTYASCWISQSISRAIEDQARLIRIPSHILDDKMKVSRIFQELLEQLERKPTLLEMADRANMPPGLVEKIVRLPLQAPLSLETPTGEGGVRLVDSIGDEHSVSPFDGVLHNESSRQIQKVLGSLQPRETTILKKRFGIDEKRRYTMEELGRQFGVSKQRIGQIQKRAMAKLNTPEKKEILRCYANTGEV